MRRFVVGALLVGAAALPGYAQVRIFLPGPPAFVVVPGAPVYYAPRASANVFFYDHQYWVFGDGGWHVGPAWNGPWAVVAPPFVPVPLLRIPVRFFPVPPPLWRGWQRDAPPRWEAHYGREWHEASREREWREREEHWDRGRHEGAERGRGPEERGRREEDRGRGRR